MGWRLLCVLLLLPIEAFPTTANRCEGWACGVDLHAIKLVRIRTVRGVKTATLKAPSGALHQVRVREEIAKRARVSEIGVDSVILVKTWIAPDGTAVDETIRLSR